eukprot:761887-Hanusia_phi.AAC.3
MRWMVYVQAAHAVVAMVDKGERRKGAAIVISTLCLLCLLCRSDLVSWASRQGSLVYYGVDGLRRYLEDKGVALVDVGIALVCYEVLGMLVLLSFWVACFMMQPVKQCFLEPIGTLVGAMREIVGHGFMRTAEDSYKLILEKVQTKFADIAKRLKVDPVRLSTAYAEGALCRGLLKPLLVPMKLYGAYLLVRGWRHIVTNISMLQEQL